MSTSGVLFGMTLIASASEVLDGYASTLMLVLGLAIIIASVSISTVVNHDVLSDTPAFRLYEKFRGGDSQTI